ncbi:hypothetical protein [Nocardia salmonicida]|uniref:MmyB family transcriptional regulator n=1 Tax=Nocardia salmonicida TaxID=53431 RepID=UPI003CF7F1B2
MRTWSDTPALVLGRHMDVLAATPLAVALNSCSARRESIRSEWCSWIPRHAIFFRTGRRSPRRPWPGCGSARAPASTTRA